MKKINTIIYGLIASVAFLGVAHADIRQDIRNIREKINNINVMKDLQVVTKKLDDVSAEGATLKGYFKNGKLLKISLEAFGETGKSVENFFVLKGNLIFYSHKIVKYDKPFGKVQSTTVKRYFFLNDKLILYSKGRKLQKSFKKDILDAAADAKTDFQKYKAMLKK